MLRSLHSCYTYAMNIHIIGAGAVGKLFASKLYELHKLILVARTGRQAEEIRVNGLFVRNFSGDHIIRLDCQGIEKYRDRLLANSIPKADLVLLTVKQQHLNEDLVETIKLSLHTHGLVIALQNGIGHVQMLTERLGSERVAVAVTTLGARALGPAGVEHTGEGWVAIGFPDGVAAHRERKKIQVVENCLVVAGFDVRLSKEISKDVWNKLVINSVINPLTAIHGITNGSLLASPFLLQVMRRLYHEAIMTAGLAGITLDEELWKELLEVCRRTARNRSSMLQDVEAGRRTEIEWINGSLVRIAREHGQALPGHEAILQAVSGIEKNR